MAKRGRKTKRSYVTPDGQELTGLVQGKDGRFRPAGHASPKWSGTWQEAFHKFKVWQAKQTATGPLEPLDSIATSLGDVEAERQRIRDMIATDPKRAAVYLDYPPLARLADVDGIQPPPLSISLDELGKLYQSKRGLTEEWKRRARLVWREFRAVVKVGTLRDVTSGHIEKYHDDVFARVDRDGHSATYVNHRFGLVKSILNHAMTRGRDQVEIRRVLDCCKMLVPPKSNGKNPQPISPEHFEKLLAVADTKWKAVYLLSLNAALYPSEVADVKKSNIDLDAGTLMMDRGKTGVPRIAVLWPRTIKAIRAYQKDNPHQSESLFVSEVGLPYNANHIGRNFRRRRADAKIPESVEFAQIRDGAETAAIEGGAELTEARMLAGHRTGVSDHYVKRNPRMVANACKAIEAHYFPKKKQVQK